METPTSESSGQTSTPPKNFSLRHTKYDVRVYVLGTSINNKSGRGRIGTAQQGFECTKNNACRVACADTVLHVNASVSVSKFGLGKTATNGKKNGITVVLERNTLACTTHAFTLISFSHSLSLVHSNLPHSASREGKTPAGESRTLTKE